MAVQNQITFKKGERLSAQKMNALANLAANLNSPTYARPDGLGFHGDVNWSQNNLNMAEPSNKPRFKPFDICPQWDASGKLSAYVVMRPMWQVFEDNEAKVLELSDDVQLTHEGGMDSVSAIYLVQLSAEEDSSESEGGQEGEGEESEDDSSTSQEEGDWKVLDNVGLQEEDRTIQNKWLLYKVGGNGLVTLDVRDAFVNLQLSSDVSSDSSGEVILDLSSLDWLSTTGDDAQLSAQSWHYNNPEQGDFADADVKPDATSNRLDSWRFFARPERGGTVQYVQLSAIVSELSALSAKSGECSCEMSALSGNQTQAEGKWRTNDKIAQFKDCQGNTTDIYAPDSVIFQGNVGTKEKTSWSNIFAFQAGTSSNVQVSCNGTNISIGCYYLGWMLPLFTMLAF